MDAESIHDSTVSIIDGDVGELEQEDYSSNGDMTRESTTGKEILVQMELDIACLCEKMVNLNILMIHVADKASEIESIEKEESSASFIEKLLEVDFIYEIYDSEVGEVGDLVVTLQKEIVNAREVILFGKYSEKGLIAILERFDDSEKSLKQSQEEVLDLKTQSAKLKSILSRFRNDENWQEDIGTGNSENWNFLHSSAKTKITSEQQRNILRMLEKSLAMEMDLEKKLMESKQIEEELNSRLRSSAQEVVSLKEQTITLLERLFEADCAAEVLKGISREQMSRLQLNQFSSKGSAQREAEMSSRIERLMSLTSKDKSENAGLRERIDEVESRADIAEQNCKILEEKNLKLEEELEITRNNTKPAIEMIESLKQQLEEADIQLQHASACVEASEEKQSMLYASINDMQTVIDGLKSKVLSAETQVDNAEDKWIMLSESNAELTDELNVLRERLDCLQASSLQAEEAKAATAKDLNVRTKVIMDLVMGLAIEREHLNKKVASIMKENKFLTEILQETKKDFSSESKEQTGKINELKEVKLEEVLLDQTTTPLEVKREETENVEIVRTIDAGQLRLKHLVMAIVVLSLSYFCFNRRNF